MSKPSESPAPIAMTAADAAKLVEREVPVLDKHGKVVLDSDGKANIKRLPVKAEEVLAFSDKGDHVIVVTKDGRKLRGDK